MLMYVPFAVLLVVFPDGVAGRGLPRSVNAGLVAVPAVFIFLLSGLVGDSFVVTVLWAACLPVFMVLLVGAVVSVRRRYRVANTKVRIQLRWLLLASGALPLTLLICWLSYLLLSGPDLVVIGLVAMAVSIPTATTIAIVRHDLYDVDRAIVAAAAYGIVITLLLAVFSAITITAGLVLGGESTVLAVVATAVTALALNPARSRIERWVARRLYPARHRALAALEELRVDVHAGRSSPERVEVVLRASWGDPGLRVGFMIPGATGHVGLDHGHVDGHHTQPVVLAGETVGVLVGGPDADEAPPREVADAAAMIVEVVRLRLEQGALLREVGESRARLIRAGYEERRTLERDLHDGAQQRLVSLGMRLRLTQRHLGDGSVRLEDVDGVLDESVAEIATAVSELRQIAHGLRPSSLDDGLPAALANLTRSSPVPIDLEMRAEDVPDDVSTTAYFVASEAVANAVKYAEADRISLSVVRVNGDLRVLVHDDGRGGAAVRAGSGLAGIADRVEALGGRLQVDSPRGTGTSIEAVLPCGS